VISLDRGCMGWRCGYLFSGHLGSLTVEEQCELFNIQPVHDLTSGAFSDCLLVTEIVLM